MTDTSSNIVCSNNKDNNDLSTTSQQLPLEKKGPRIVVVSLHGMDMDNSQDEKIEEALSNKYHDQVVVIKPTYRKESFCGVSKSITSPLTHSWVPWFFKFLRGCGFPTQLNGVFKEIKDKLKENNIQTDRDFVFIMGISQGGLLALILADNYKEDLNIKGVIAINAALGVHCLQNTMDDVNRFLLDGKKGLQAIGCSDKVIEEIKKNSRVQLRFTKCAPGIASMLPSSSCVNQAMKFLDNSTIPCLLMGSYIDHIFNKIRKAEPYHPLSDKDHNLEKDFATLITGKEDGYHDGLIATSNQLHIGNGQITHLEENTIYQDPKNKNLHRVLFKGPTHANKIVPIMLRLPILIDIEKAPVIEHDQRVPERIIEFIDQVVMAG